MLGDLIGMPITEYCKWFITYRGAIPVADSLIQRQS
jgi:hypothetical protein